MKKQKIHCVVVDQDVEVTASLDAALRHSDVLLELNQVASVQQLIPVLQELQPHLLFCPYDKSKPSVELLETLQRYSPDTLLVWVARDEWQGLTTWLMGVESCILPLRDLEYFGQYIDFLLRYSSIKQDFRDCKHLLGVAELRCHWLVDYSWEAIAYISQGMHLYANNAYVTLFGFEGMAEVRSMPVAHLVDNAERKIFEAMSKAADVGSKPSNRLLITLRTLEGERMRAEIRFIPAVLKGKRCTQLHVKPLERNILKGVSLRKQDNPWEATELRLQKAPAPRGMPEVQGGLTPAVPSAVDGMKMVFRKLQRMQETLPNLYLSEPEFQQKSQKLDYTALVKQLGNGGGRFRLDYWNLGQVVSRLSSQGNEKPDYLVFVSVGSAILNNEAELKRVVELLNTAPEVAKRMVLAFQYQDCMANIAQLGKVIKLLKVLGVHLAIDGLPDSSQSLKFVQVVKPVLVRLDANAVNDSIHSTNTNRLQCLIDQLVESRCKVIMPSVQDQHFLKVAYSTAAAYVQAAT
ncbi:MAG: EAL domain-containing protein [Candidatus Thiothrix putei]|uniref:EAL domain-containing protein n=1 Tax=Candidatus Thiothrix putei TaxID=3080811 RepID=A0AA95HAG2_9GAMM|nr:MAG: EAL domain-containing protein [Candidatus Thiothrix putei]